LEHPIHVSKAQFAKKTMNQTESKEAMVIK